MKAKVTHDQISGPRIDGSFRTGWAKGWTGERAHFFRKVEGYQLIEAECGHVTTSEVVFGIGTYIPCASCVRVHGMPEPHQ